MKARCSPSRAVPASRTPAPGGDDDVVTPGVGQTLISDLADIQQADPVGNSPFNTIVVNWNGAAVEDLLFDVIDLDGNHEFRGRIYDDLFAGNLLHEIIIGAGDPGTGDGVATPIDFTGFSGIRRLEFEVENLSAGNSGFAADNFSFTVLEQLAVPEPASIAIWLLLGVALGGYAARRAGKRVATA